MTPSLIKILDGKFHEGELKLTLTVLFILGRPQKGDVVFSPESVLGVYFYPVEEVIKKESSKIYELILDYHEPDWVWETRWEKHIKEGECFALCGLSVESYQNLAIKEKVNYFSLLADFIGVGRVPQFIKQNIKPVISLSLKNKEAVIGLTKFGGLPIASKDLTFPKDGNGKSALFIGQINIKEWESLQTINEFKGDGILYFFGTVMQEGERYGFNEILVRYLKQINGLSTIALPADLEEYGVFRENAIIVSEEIAIPLEETSLWPHEIMSKEESSSYFEINNFVELYNSNCLSTLLRHSNQISESLKFYNYLKYLNLTSNDWGNADGTVDQSKWDKIENQVADTAIQWRHLFYLDMEASYFNQLSNFHDKFNHYVDEYNVMIKKKDLDLMNFDNTETTTSSY